MTVKIAKDNIKIGKIKGTKFITITTPCRIGRSY